VQLIKVQLVLSSAVRVVAVRIDSYSLLRDEICIVLVQKAVHLGLAYRLPSNRGREISNYSSRRRQRFPRVVFNMLYECCFLFCVKLLSPCSPIASRPLTGPVSSRQCSLIYTELSSNCAVRGLFSKFVRFNCCNRIVN
jgi:hypothetical protein